MNDETPADAGAEKTAATGRATTAKGKPCRNRPRDGSAYCGVHAALDTVRDGRARLPLVPYGLATGW